jgi:hypothetical protein
MFLTDAAIQNGYTALKAELEKEHPEINEPLGGSTWARDIPFEMGGGFLEYVSNWYAEFQTADQDEDSIITSETNTISVMQGGFSKEAVQTFTYGKMLRLSWLAMQKMMNIGTTSRDIKSLLERGIGKHWNKWIDRGVYYGFQKYGGTGLVNSPLITSSLAAQSATTGNSRLWTGKTQAEILADVNNLINSVLANIGYDEDAIPDTVGLPWANYTYISGQTVTNAADKSTLNFLRQNNILTEMGKQLTIVPMRQLIGAGAGATNRAIAYKKDKDTLQFDMTVPLNSLPEQMQNKDMAYFTPFVGQISQLQIKRPQAMAYLDGI